MKKSDQDETAIEALYGVWKVLREDLEPLLDPKSGATDEMIDPKLEATWALEHVIAGMTPASLDDVRIKALIVKHWMNDAETEHIVDELLNSLITLPEAPEAKAA